MIPDFTRSLPRNRERYLRGASRTEIAAITVLLSSNHAAFSLGRFPHEVETVAIVDSAEVRSRLHRACRKLPMTAIFPAFVPTNPIGHRQIGKDSVEPDENDKPRESKDFLGYRWRIWNRVVAEQEGFEPSIRGYRIHTFQACAFDHSATAPHSSCRATASLFERLDARSRSPASSSAKRGTPNKNARL